MVRSMCTYMGDRSQCFHLPLDKDAVFVRDFPKDLDREELAAIDVPCRTDLTICSTANIASSQPSHA